MTITPEALNCVIKDFGRAVASDTLPSIYNIELVYRALSTGHLVLVDDGAVERVAVPKKLTPEMEQAGIAASEDYFVMDSITVTGLHKFYEAALAALQVKP